MNAKRAVTTALFTTFLFFGAGSTFAQTCPTPRTGPHYAGVASWYNYTPDNGCWTASGSVSSPATVGCSGLGGVEFGMGWTNKISYTFPVGTSDHLFTNNWEASAFIEFNDPNDSIYNNIVIWARVLHNGVTTSTKLFEHGGHMGDLSGCASQWNYFSATNGDTVTIEVTSTKWYSNTVIRASYPRIFNVN